MKTFSGHDRPTEDAHDRALTVAKVRLYMQDNSLPPATVLVIDSLLEGGDRQAAWRLAHQKGLGREAFTAAFLSIKADLQELLQ